MEQNGGHFRMFLVPDTNQMTDETFSASLHYVGAQKRRLQTMRRPAAYNSLTGLLLAKYAVASIWSLPLAQLQFDVGSHGKPYFIGLPQIHFNVSHSGNVCICAVDDTPVGIDIQVMKPCRFDAIVRRYFTEQEQISYQEQGADASAFYRIWTQRESVGKYLGKGFFYTEQDDTADWTATHFIYCSRYMVCICRKQSNIKIH